MAEAELYELMAAYTANSISAFTIYVSLTFGYLSVGYLVAQRLTAFQAITSSAIYVFAAFSCVFTLLAELSIMQALGDRLAETSESWSGLILNDLSIWIPAMAVITSVGVIASVYFFYSIRMKNP